MVRPKPRQPFGNELYNIKITYQEHYLGSSSYLIYLRILQSHQHCRWNTDTNHLSSSSCCSYCCSYRWLWCHYPLYSYANTCSGGTLHNRDCGYKRKGNFNMFTSTLIICIVIQFQCDICKSFFPSIYKYIFATKDVHCKIVMPFIFKWILKYVYNYRVYEYCIVIQIF